MHRTGLAVSLMLVAVAWSAPPPQAAPITPHEQTLWDRVVEAQRPVPATQPFRDWFDAARQRRRLLLSRVDLYLTLYPGGAYRDEAVRLELLTLFELGALRGGAQAALTRRLDELLAAPPSVAAQREAAFWAMTVRRPPPAGVPDVSAAATELDPESRRAFQECVRTQPRDRHVPRLAALLFEDAARRDDRAVMTELVDLLTREFSTHPVTAAVRGQWHRREAIGELFEPPLRTPDGKPVDWAAYRGRPVLLVVWAAFDDNARRTVQRINHFQAGHAQVAAVGVSLDETVERTATAARELEVNWPQCNDGRGWGGEFVRQWGIDRLPHVFVIDAAGRLSGSDGGEGWEALVREVLPDHERPPGRGG